MFQKLPILSRDRGREKDRQTDRAKSSRLSLRGFTQFLFLKQFL